MKLTALALGGLALAGCAGVLPTFEAILTAGTALVALAPALLRRRTA